MGNKSWTSDNFHQSYTITNQVKSAVVNVKRTDYFDRTGASNPNWVKQTMNGQNASTNMTITLRRCHLGVPWARVDYRTWHPFNGLGPQTFDVRHDIVNNFDNGEITTHFGPSLPEAESRATSNLYKTIRSLDHQFSGGVFVGELHKSVKMLLGAGRNFRKNVLSYLTGARALAKRKGTTSGNIQSAYLEAVFGWQPLIQDCKDAAIAIGRARDNLPRVRFRAMGQADKDYSPAPQVVDVLQRWIHTRKRWMTTMVVYYGAFKVSEGGLPVKAPAERLVALSGFDLRSFLPTAWELIPYSFLIDYFVNIGEVLDAFSTDTSTVGWLSKVVINQSSENANLQMIGPSAANIAFYTTGASAREGRFSGTSGNAVRFLRTISRTANPGMPTLAPRFKFEELGAKQFLNIAALLTR